MEGTFMGRPVVGSVSNEVGQVLSGLGKNAFMNGRVLRRDSLVGGRWGKSDDKLAAGKSNNNGNRETMHFYVEDRLWKCGDWFRKVWVRDLL